MTNWLDPEEVRLYQREWQRRRKASLPTRQQVPLKEMRVSNCCLTEDTFSDLDPNRPIDPVPEPNMHAETWEELEDMEEMSRPGDCCYQTVQTEKALRLARLDRVIPDPKLVKCLFWSDVKTILFILTDDQYRRINPFNPWWIDKDEIMLALRRAGWVEQKGNRRFLPSQRSPGVGCSRAVDRVLRDPYEYYPIDMMDLVKRMPQHQKYK